MNEAQLQQYKQSAIDAINDSDWEKARSILIKITDTDNVDYYVWHQLGYCHLALADAEQAIECLNKSIEINPDFEHAYVILSHAQVQQRDIKNAVTTLKKLIEKFPASAEGYSLLGGAYMQDNQYKEAEKYLIQALDIDPDMINTRLHLGVLQSHLGDYQSSIEHLKIVLPSGEYTGEVHNLLAHAYQNSGDYENAIMHYEKAIELMPGVEDPVLGLKSAQAKLQQ